MHQLLCITHAKIVITIISCEGTEISSVRNKQMACSELGRTTPSGISFIFPEPKLCCALGETPVYDDRQDRLLYTDILAGHLHIYDLQKGQTDTFDITKCTSACLLTERDDQVLVIAPDGVWLFNLKNRDFKQLCALDFAERGLRANECQVLSDGLYISSMSLTAQAHQGFLLRLTPSSQGFKTEQLLEHMTVPNTLVEDDERIYIHDSLEKKFYAISKAEHKVYTLQSDFEEGSIPDGSCALSDGSVLTADWGLSLLRHTVLRNECWHTIETFSVPQRQPSSVAACGKNFDVFYITSATQGMLPEKCSIYDGAVCKMQLPSTLKLVGQKSYRLAI